MLTIGLNRAVDLLAQPSNRPARIAARVLGADPADGKPVAVGTGRYGPYVRHGSVFANVPKGTTVEAVTLEQALGWLAERKAAAPAKGGAKAKAKAAPKARSAAAAKVKVATGKTTTGKTAAGKTPAAETTAKAARGRKTAPAE